MTEHVSRLACAETQVDVESHIDAVLAAARRGRLGDDEQRLFIRNLLLNQALQTRLETAAAVDYLLAAAGDDWASLFAKAIEKQVPEIIVELIDSLADVAHVDALRLAGNEDAKTLVGVLKKLDAYLGKLDDSERYLRGMRASCVQADIYRLLADPKIWRRRKVPSCTLDSQAIASLKEDKDVEALPDAYEARINQLQRRDLRVALHADEEPSAEEDRQSASMQPEDFERLFVVESPLRLGISSANASDNHMRTREQGGKTLNAGIDLWVEKTGEFAPPLKVEARRLEEPRLVLRSLSSGFKADFEVNTRGSAHVQSDLFFAYQRGGDESLRMVKEALVHTGIVLPRSGDVAADIVRFTAGGGLEVVTSSQVMQGSGLGTSSILAAAILKALYRLTGHESGTDEGEYPALYDHSVLLEQNLGLNSGWQDARGARGGASAVKDLYAPPASGPPAPEISFVEVDEDRFVDRVVLFDTGISRAATRGLNIVLDAYLRRDRERYSAIRESLAIHDDMVAALRAEDFSALAAMATRYWQLRCILDPGATSETLQYLFEAPELTEVCEGGLLTGAGGGGFALLICPEGAAEELKARLSRFREQRAFAGSRVVEYRLNKTGLKLTEGGGVGRC